MASDAAVSSAPVSAEGQIGNFTSDYSASGSTPLITAPEILVSSSSSSDDKKPVWNKPVVAVSPVMGAVSWPALGEVSKSSPKSASSESLKGLADGPFPPALHLVTENLSSSASSSPKQANANNVHHASIKKHVGSPKQRSVKRGNGGGATQSHLSGASRDLVSENAHSASGNVKSPRGNSQVETVKGGFGSQAVNGNDRQHQKNTYRRSNSGPHSRGDGSFNHHGYGGKREQDREWNQHSRSFNGRDTNVNSQRGYPRGGGGGGYMRPNVHTPPPFIPPQMPLMRPFGNTMMYTDLPSPVFYVGPPHPPEALRGMSPLVGPMPPPMYFVSDPMLHARIVSQVDYYFSNDNLVKDTYLRKNMDEQGWVPVSLIAGFQKVLYLTDNIQLILDAMRASTIVEVQGDKIRRRNDWMRWLMQPAAQTAGYQDILASQLQGVSLDGATSTILDSARGDVEIERLII